MQATHCPSLDPVRALPESSGGTGAAWTHVGTEEKRAAIAGALQLLASVKEAQAQSGERRATGGELGCEPRGSTRVAPN
jgi:hypothetical protein